jgi:hypothetical protein
MRWLRIFVVVGVFLLIVTRPQQAANIAASLGDTVFGWMGNAGTFVASLAEDLPT